MNEIIDADSTTLNVRISSRERHTVEIPEHKMKGLVYMQASKVKKIDNQTKNEPTIRSWDKTNKKKYTQIVHPQHGLIYI